MTTSSNRLPHRTPLTNSQLVREQLNHIDGELNKENSSVWNIGLSKDYLWVIDQKASPFVKARFLFEQRLGKVDNSYQSVQRLKSKVIKEFKTDIERSTDKVLEKKIQIQKEIIQLSLRLQQEKKQPINSKRNPISSNPKDPFDVLPVEIAYQILSYFDGKSLTRAAGVCKKWRELTGDEKFHVRITLDNLNLRYTPPSITLTLGFTDSKPNRFKFDSVSDKNIAIKGIAEATLNKVLDLSVPSRKLLNQMLMDVRADIAKTYNRLDEELTEIDFDELTQLFLYFDKADVKIEYDPTSHRICFSKGLWSLKYPIYVSIKDKDQGELIIHDKTFSYWGADNYGKKEMLGAIDIFGNFDLEETLKILSNIPEDKGRHLYFSKTDTGFQLCIT